MKRRKRRARHAGRRDAFHLTMIAVLMTVLCLMIVNIKEPEQTEEEQPETTHAEVVQNPETIVQTAEETESKYKVFDGMSEDWGSDDLEGFVLYKLPEQYADVGWEKSDNSEHFYVKFINWGTIYRPPQEFIYATGREADAELQKIAEQEYQSYLDNTMK